MVAPGLGLSLQRDRRLRLSPAWLQVVQAFVSLAFLASFTAQVFVALILMRWPLAFWRQFGYEMTLTALILTSCVSEYPLPIAGGEGETVRRGEARNHIAGYRGVN